jgi:septal ring factor EnvC (AmiA/AmiB activator)
LLESLAVTDQPRATIPWALAAASVLLVVLTVYLLFGAYLPTKKRITRLEAELKDVYAREAQLQTRIAKDTEQGSQREQRLAAFTAERDALAKRVEELEKEIAARKPPARPRK